MESLGYASAPFWGLRKVVFGLTLNNPSRADDVVQAIALAAWSAHVRGGRADLNHLRTVAFRAADERSP